MEIHELIEIGSLMSIPNFIFPYISFIFNGIKYLTGIVYDIFPLFSSPDVGVEKRRFGFSICDDNFDRNNLEDFAVLFRRTGE